MRIVAFFLTLFFSIPALNAQVQLQVSIPGAGLVQKNQLWNIIIANNSVSALEGRIELVLIDRVTSQEVMTASTVSFLAPRGSMVINVNKVSPVIYNYIGMEPDRNLNSLLPAGSYSACYSFVRNPDSDKREVMAEECIAFDVEPLSPPLLIFPSDSSVLETAPTQFTWTPPVPAAMINRLRYEVIISEVGITQLATEAIEENNPLFSTSRAQDNFLTYTTAQPAFEKEKWYAWQVIARDDNAYAGKSEVWVFKVKAPRAFEEVLNATAYVELQKAGAGKTVAPNGVLRFYYFNQLADDTVVCKVRDLGVKGETEAMTVAISLKRGQNYLQKDISRFLKLEEGHTYMLSLQNSAKEKWNILFEIKKY